MNQLLAEKMRAAASALAEVALALEANGHAAGTASTPARPASTPVQPGPQRPPPRGETPLAPFGRMKGAPLDTLETKDLVWLEGALERSINDPSKDEYRAKNERDVQNIRRELQSRAP